MALDASDSYLTRLVTSGKGQSSSVNTAENLYRGLNLHKLDHTSTPEPIRGMGYSDQPDLGFVLTHMGFISTPTLQNEFPTGSRGNRKQDEC